MEKSYRSRRGVVEGVRRCGSQPRLLSWKRPSFRHVVNCDGSYKEWTQECGYGIIIRDSQGRFTFAKAKHFKKADLDDGEVEYWTMVLMVEMMAIRDGMRLARGLNIKDIEVQSDSKNAIRVIGGLSRCPRECLGILFEIIIEACFFEGLAFEFVYREQNRAADFLSTLLDEDGQEICFDLAVPRRLMKIIGEDVHGVGTIRW